jgi:hypothetical protein
LKDASKIEGYATIPLDHYEALKVIEKESVRNTINLNAEIKRLKAEKQHLQDQLDAVMVQDGAR